MKLKKINIESHKSATQKVYSFFFLKTIVLFFFLIFAEMLLFTACQKKEEKLTKASIKIVDTLWKHRRDSLKAEWDSLCDLRYNAILDRALDSILIERKKAEERLRTQ